MEWSFLEMSIVCLAVWPLMSTQCCNILSQVFCPRCPMCSMDKFRCIKGRLSIAPTRYVGQKAPSAPVANMTCGKGVAAL